MHRTLPILVIAVAGCLVGSFGCSSMRSERQEASRLPMPQMSPDAVVFEVAFATVPREELAAVEDLWRLADELHLSPELRRNLGDNGLRCGILDSQLPPAVRELVASNSNPLEQLVNSQEQKTAPRQQRLQCRAGRRAEILAHNDLKPSLTVLTLQQGRLLGETLDNAQCLFSLYTEPLGDGRVEIRLTPEIQHGHARPTWVGQEGAFRIDAKRQKKLFEDLRMELTLATGQILVVGCTDEARGLGKDFFAESSGADAARDILLIRLAQTQADELFAPEKIRAPIATTGG